MTVDTWLTVALADAERRGLPELKPLLESLAATMRTLRAAGFTGSAANADGVISSARTESE
jgi:hypothetical protein